MGLSKTYRLSNRRCVEALRNVSIEIPRGQFVFIAGPSGSGKSTLLNLLGCLDRPSKGRVCYSGEDTTGFSEEALCRIRRDKIGFIFQGFHLLPGMTAWENVSAGLIPLGVGEKERFRRSCAILDRLGLQERIFHVPEELSGGEQQRVCAARALINEPDVVLADEPSSNIDAASAAEVLGALNDLREKGSAVVIATHDAGLVKNSLPRAIASYADKTFHLFAGRLSERVNS